ncbi:MAG: TetR/AcrR family transcriptional regulator [Myxococcales bacterium]|nr:TetR/AcrR family transcriptional regulator [Myxococcales bacterium]MDH3484873.1 TetR/AcrR family transcriptional regulator [Myxococcales bacterium]
MDAAPKRMTTEARRDHLLAFGRAHFAAHAYDAMSMDAIAERAGVSKGLLYHYFGGQRGFYMETVRAVTDEVIAVIEPPTGVSFEEAFRAMVRSFAGYVQDNGPIYQALVRGGLGSDTEVNALLDRVRVRAHDIIVERLGIVYPSSLTQIAIYGWVSFVENGAAEWVECQDVSAEVLIDLFVSAFGPVLSTLQKGQCQ